MVSIGSSRRSSESQQTSRDYIDPGSLQTLRFLQNQGMGLAGAQLGNIGQDASRLAGQLGGLGQGFLGQLGQGALGNLASQQSLAQSVNQAISGQGPGADFLQQRLSQQNPFLNQQIAALGQDIGQAFQESILPGIRRNAVSVGGLGGGRQGVAEGLAAEGVTRQFAQQAANLRASDLAQRQIAAAQLAQNALAGGQLAGAGVGQQLAASQAGLAALPGQFDLGLSPYAAQFAPLQALAGVVGAPTVLNTSQGTTRSSGRSFQFGAEGSS